MKRLRAGIIGLGVGEAHAEGYFRHPRCTVAAVCDFEDEKLAKAKGKYPGVKTTKEADEILEDPSVDVVSIASYDSDHFGQVMKGLSHGKHLFVEKPVCQFETQLSQIRGLLRVRSELQFSSNLILRKSPRFQRLKEMMDAGKLGRPFYVEGDYNYGRLHKITDGWRGKLDFYSVTQGGGVHMIDLLLWLTGDRVEEVSTYGNAICSEGTGFNSKDMVVSLLKFRSGMVGKVASNFGCMFPHFHRFLIYGTSATFENGFENGFLYESREPGIIPTIIDAPYPGMQKWALIQGFVDAILQGGACEVTKEDIFDTLCVCFAIEKSLQESRPVKVAYI